MQKINTEINYNNRKKNFYFLFYFFFLQFLIIFLDNIGGRLLSDALKILQRGLMH